jgi:colanic acid/amylovoran biosynthesis glycosyltransferase
MKKNKEIIFKVPEFPHLSETFIIAQMVTAIKLGFCIKIVTRKRISDTSLISPIIFEHNLLDNIIIEDYKIPNNKLMRLFKWCLILIKNVFNLKSIIHFHQEFSKFSLSWLYQWHFYFQFNDDSIIHVQYGTYSYPYRVLKRSDIFKPKVIVTFHGHDAFFPLYGKIPNNGYYEKLFSNDTLITANTPYLGDQLLELGCSEGKLKIAPVGVDTTFFYPNKKNIIKKESELCLITVGRLDKVKGHQYCIEVIRKMKALGVNVKLTIIGEGEERNNIEELIFKYKLEKNVFLLGKKSPAEIRQSLWKNDLYLFLGVPVENGRRETQGLATLEAQACGVPVIAFDSGGVKYTIQNGKTGFLCKEFDIDAVVDKVKLFDQNRNLINEMSKQATIFVNNEYSQNIVDHKWKVIYNTLSDE